LLAPVRNDRISAGKMPAATAGFVGSRHAGGEAVQERQKPGYKVATLRAFNRDRICGTPLVFGVQHDRLDHEVECVNAVDLACHAVG
jgi:hypothetical protein